MKQFRCKVENPLGIHARPAALLAQLCVGIRSTVSIKCNGKEANGNNVLQILALKAGKGDVLEITVEGDNEAEDVEK
ncbi:MAG: HPr family phosphocarrier protein, partial [Erysipelotrichaceae bacterium]|nr:HPr family phosphocarrier protein [Erysipelotrichaceae bacterium]